MIAKENKNKHLTVCQESLLYLMEVLHKICIENNIKYNIDCGTLIGAVRENGFIPWDDDCDIVFLRDEYEKFLDVLNKTVLPKDVSLFKPEEYDHFLDFNYRLYKNDVIIRNDEASKKRYGGFYSHPSLDIFVLDDIPENKIKARFFVLLQQIVFGLAMSKRYDINYKKYRFVERIGIRILSLFGNFFTIKSICKFHVAVSKIYHNKSTKIYGTCWSPEYPGWVYDKKWYSDFVLKDFESTKFYIPIGYDEILKYGYGDYMKPVNTHDHEKFIENL